MQASTRWNDAGYSASAKALWNTQKKNEIKKKKNQNKTEKPKPTGGEQHFLLKKMTQWEKMDTAGVIQKNWKQPT